jgi:hypothetical protein
LVACAYNMRGPWSANSETGLFRFRFSFFNCPCITENISSQPSLPTHKETQVSILCWLYLAWIGSLKANWCLQYVPFMLIGGAHFQFQTIFFIPYSLLKPSHVQILFSMKYVWAGSFSSQRLLTLNVRNSSA